MLYRFFRIKLLVYVLGWVRWFWIWFLNRYQFLTLLHHMYTYKLYFVVFVSYNRSVINIVISIRHYRLVWDNYPLPKYVCVYVRQARAKARQRVKSSWIVNDIFFVFVEFKPLMYLDIFILYTTQHLSKIITTLIH